MALAEVAPAASPAAHAAGLDDLKAMWSEIIKALAKKNPAAAAQAQSHWELEAFDGRKLTVRCTKPGIFHEEQMKENFPHLAKVIHELTGVQVIPIAAAEMTPSVRQTASATPAPQTPVPKPKVDGDKDDLFTSFVHRMDGKEIDPNAMRGSRKSSA
jgi:hypothetical protein